MGTAAAIRPVNWFARHRDHSYGWNNAMDITGAVTGEMDAILPEVTLP